VVDQPEITETAVKTVVDQPEITETAVKNSGGPINLLTKCAPRRKVLMTSCLN